ncbi:transcriptional repressor [Candidatus Saccharibacteria bacterium]|nr:transcriptional repressor [Candidatus Saccharibacteria bacterium]
MASNIKYHTNNRDKFDEIIKSFNRPFTAKDIPHLSTTTTYRLLDEYEKAGILKKVLGPDGSASYYYIEPCDDKNHLLLECTKCHTIYHIDCAHLHSFTKHISKKHGFEISNYQLVIQGVCEFCKEYA